MIMESKYLLDNDLESQIDNKPICTICLDNDNMVRLPCEHEICINCIKNIKFNKNNDKLCPYCRRVFGKKKRKCISETNINYITFDINSRENDTRLNNNSEITPTETILNCGCFLFLLCIIFVSGLFISQGN